MKVTRRTYKNTLQVLADDTPVVSHAGERFGVQGPIVRISAEVHPGNSRPPLLDRRGRLAGVVYAVAIATDFTLAIPIDTVDSLLKEAGTTTVPPCGSE